jgi:aryl-alcohol dehydrogenase-like predicted oxidoreductase
MQTQQHLNTRPFGNTGMIITRVGLGTWAIGGGDWAFAWGSQDDQESIASIHRALDLGINWIDTAAVYGLGHSEEIVGQAIKGRPERPYIFTKCSLVWDQSRKVSNSLKAGSVKRECEASLRRLGIDAIDLYQIHWPNPESEIEEGWAAMAELKREGKVRHIGVSNFNVAQMERLQRIAPVETLQPPYSLIDRHIERDILPYCQQHNIGVIVYSPMASGLLTGKMTPQRVASMEQDDWRRNDEEFQEPRLSRNLQLADLLRRIGERHQVSAGAVAIAWTLRHPAVTAAIVGARRPDQIDETVVAANLQLTDEDLAEIDAFLRAHP